MSKRWVAFETWVEYDEEDPEIKDALIVTFSTLHEFAHEAGKDLGFTPHCDATFDQDPPPWA